MTDLFSAMATGSEASLRIIPFLHRVVAAFFYTKSRCQNFLGKTKCKSKSRTKKSPSGRCVYIYPFIDKTSGFFHLNHLSRGSLKKRPLNPQKIVASKKNKKRSPRVAGEPVGLGSSPWTCSIDWLVTGFSIEPCIMDIKLSKPRSKTKRANKMVILGFFRRKKTVVTLI